MGMDLSVYVGVFISVPKVQKSIGNQLCRCTKGCSGTLAASAKFCPTCGAPTALYGKPRIELGEIDLDATNAPSARQFWIAPYAAGIAPGECVLLPNAAAWGRSVNVEEGETKVFPAIDSIAIMAQFKAEFKDLLEHITQVHAVTPTVCWGAVSYAT